MDGSLSPMISETVSDTCITQNEKLFGDSRNSLDTSTKGESMYFVIKRKLPSLNEVIDANRENKYVGAKLKRELQEEIGWYIVSAVMHGDLAPRVNSCTIFIRWHESTMRRDVDNIQSAQKFILDAMVKQGILKTDSRKYVSQIQHEVVDDKEDYVEVFVNGTEREDTKSREKTEESLLSQKGNRSKEDEVS